jgi:hypothetical protein
MHSCIYPLSDDVTATAGLIRKVVTFVKKVRLLGVAGLAPVVACLVAQPAEATTAHATSQKGVAKTASVRSPNIPLITCGNALASLVNSTVIMSVSVAALTGADRSALPFNGSACRKGRRAFWRQSGSTQVEVHATPLCTRHRLRGIGF